MSSDMFDRARITTLINSVEDIQSLLAQGFTDWKALGNVSVKASGELSIFNYTAKCQYESRWNFFEQVSRGLILDKRTGEIVARPFDKFFNWGEGDRVSLSPIKTITQKMDGSLGILYRENGGCRIATRGSFESDQAIWATDFLIRYDLSKLPHNLTLLFEIIYPDNRIVVDYQGRQDLILLAARNRFTGDYVSWFEVQMIAAQFDFSMPQTYQFQSPEAIVAAAAYLSADAEGWVVEFEDGQRFKFKGQDYLKIHKIISNLSFKNTLAHIEDETLSKLYETVPDEFLPEIRRYANEIEKTIADTRNYIEIVFGIAPKKSRKEFAIWVIKNHKHIAPYLFARFDKKDLKPLIIKMAF